MRSIRKPRSRAGRGLSGALLVGVTMVLAAASNAQELAETAVADARATVERLHAALIEAAVADDFSARYDALLPVVRETHDLGYIASLAIRRQWRDLDTQAREAFVGAFERLSVATYASRFASVTPGTFKIAGARALDDGRIEVNAAINRANEAPDVSLDYVLQRSSGAWRIVNIVADGVSDLALKRAQYQRVFRDGGTIDDLIRNLSDEADAL